MADGQLVFIGEAQTAEVSTRPDGPPAPSGPTGRVPIHLVGASRSGYRWLTEFLTVDRLRELRSERAPLGMERRTLDFVNAGWLGDPAAPTIRLRAGVIDLPEVLML
jgi:hypothetical protein